MTLAIFLKNILQLLTGVQFDICYVIKTRVGFEIVEITRFLTAIHLLFKIVIHLNSVIHQEYVYSEVVCL